ncbi:hypothetical protein [Ekhidna sp.]|uniref:hypothetical protein n=1 Tax=Ekhidna sp. TaxID=2608089 RepID=UPI0032EDE5A7
MASIPPLKTVRRFEGVVGLRDWRGMLEENWQFFTSTDISACLPTKAGCSLYKVPLPSGLDILAIYLDPKSRLLLILLPWDMLT